MRSLAPAVALVALGCSGSEVRLTGTVSDFLTGNGIDAQVCGDDDLCVETEADGSYELKVPISNRLLLRITSGSHAPVVVPVRTGQENKDLGDVGVVSTLASNAQYTLLGIDAVPETGSMMFSVFDGVLGDGMDVAGVTVSLDPDEGDGPLYWSTLGLPTLDEDQTTTNGRGSWLNLPPGVYAADFDGINTACTTELGWGPPGAFEFEVVRAHATVLRLECAE